MIIRCVENAPRVVFITSLWACFSVTSAPRKLGFLSFGRFLEAKKGGALKGVRLGLRSPSGGRLSLSRGLLSLLEIL